MQDIIFVLGASDAEMTAIQKLLTDLGVTFVFANHGGRRVHPAVMYHANPLCFRKEVKLVLVECGFSSPPDNEILCVIDHHQEGDPGFRKPPSEFWEASSIGQTFHFLNCLGLDLTPTEEHRFVAAADHCLGAAYKGQCPGIDVEALKAWRLASRAEYQDIPLERIQENVEKAYVTLEQATSIALDSGIYVKDMRRDTPVKELPEAAMRQGVAYLCGPVSRCDGMDKYTASGSPEVIRAFMEVWAPSQGLVNIYGDPMRGFAGGYLEVCSKKRLQHLPAYATAMEVAVL